MNSAVLPKPALLALLLVTIIGAFYLATIREGHVWGDDQAAYIAHARNIVTGVPYGDIGYVRSPTSINPTMYPPGFPLLLAPVYHFFGINLAAMKVLCILFFCAALFLLYLLVRDADAPQTALFAVAITGFCPYFWDFKDILYSEFPFMALSYAALLASQIADAHRDSKWQRLLLGILVGMLIGLACSVRSIGILLVPVIVGYDSWRARKLTRFGVAVAGVFLLVTIALKVAFKITSDYWTPYQQIASVRVLLGSPFYYLRCFSVMWDNGRSETVQMVLYAGLGLLAVMGWWVRIRTRCNAMEIFCIGYFLFVCLFPWGGRRYLMPIMPFFAFYLLIGLGAPCDKVFNRFKFWLRWAVVLMIGGSYLSRYTAEDWRNVPGRAETKDTAELVQYMKSNRRPGDVVVFRKPRWFALQSGSVSAEILKSDRPEKALQYYRGIGVTHIVASTVFHDDAESALACLISQSREHLVLQFTNASFAVYEMRIK